MINKRSIGTYGEDLACDYLKNKGYIILDRNFHSRRGELDIIAKCKNILVFVEVKSRYYESFGSGLESITYAKIGNIINTSRFYINSRNLYFFNVRYDVILINLDLEKNKKSIYHYEDAFRS